jgi:hypothetical protein
MIKILHGPAFENYMCAIDDQLTMIPIVTPCCTPTSGLRFEKSAIEKWVVIGGNKNCPLCRASLNQEDLVYDDKRVADIVRAARAQIALLNTSQVEYAPQLQEGFTAIIDDGIEHASQINEIQAKVEAEKALSLKAGEDEYIEAMRKVYRTQRAELGISSETVTK